MNALKHMEAVFVVVAAAALSVTFFTTEAKPLDVAADSTIAVQNVADMPVVTIVGKRINSAGKTALM